MIENIVLLIVIASWIYWIIAYWLTRDFFLRPQPVNTGFTPSVSILKPARGLDNQAYQNFASFCELDYPSYELLFGVSDIDDPVIPVIQRLQNDYPHRDITLVISPSAWTNPKASLLHTLATKARNQVLVVSDSDMRVTQDYLRRVVSPLADSQVGLITCPYRGENPVTFTARLEALHMGATFLPSIIVARMVLSMRFAMGATVVMRAEDLRMIGGFASVADYLADDYQLGHRIANLGLRVHLSDYIVASLLGPTTFLEQWNREVRWAHCNRVSRPSEYPGIILTFTTPLSTLFLLFSHFSPLAWQVMAASLMLRWTIAWLIFQITDNRPLRKWLIWLPLRDMLSALVWCAGAIGQGVEWRGSRYILLSDGRLAAYSPRFRFSSELVISHLTRIIQLIDALYYRYVRTFEFNSEAECLLRLAITHNDRELTLSDGTTIYRGEPIGELHIWKEHIPRIPPAGPNISWAIAFQNNLKRSLQNLAEYIQTDTEIPPIQAFCSQVYFSSGAKLIQRRHFFNQWGFELLDLEREARKSGRLIDRTTNYYSNSLFWERNAPTGNRGSRSRDVEHCQIWITRNTLLQRYTSKPELTKKVEETAWSEHLPVN